MEVLTASASTYRLLTTLAEGVGRQQGLDGSKNRGENLVLGLKEKRDKEKEIFRREEVSRREVEMLEGTFRVFLACFSPSRSSIYMYWEGCAFHL